MATPEPTRGALSRAALRVIEDPVALIAIVLAALSMALSTVLWTQQRDATNRNHDLIVEVASLQQRLNEAQQHLNRALLTSCKRVGEPTRQAVVGMLGDQIAQSTNPTLLQALFPNVPRDLLDRQIARSLRKSRRHLAELERVPPCHAWFQ